MKAILRSGAEVGVAQGLDLLAGLFTAGLTARFLGASGLGELSLVLAVFLVGNTVADLGASALLTRETVREPEKARALLSTNLTLKLSILAIVVAACVPASIFAGGLGAALSGLPFLVFSSLNISLAASLRALGAFSALWRAALPAFLLQAAGSYVLLARHGNVEAVLLLMGGAQGVKLLLLALTFGSRTRRSGALSPTRWGWCPDAKEAEFAAGPRALLRAALPFAGVVALGTVYLKVDVFLLSALSGSEETGVYAAASRVTEFLKLLPGAFFAALYPALVRREKEDRPGRAPLLPIAAASGAATLALLAGAPILIKLLYGSGLASSAATLRLLALAVVPSVLSSALLLQMYAASKERAVLRISGLGLAAKVLLNAILIPEAGATGAALAWVGAEWFQLGLYVRASRDPVTAHPLPRWVEPALWGLDALAFRLAFIFFFPAHFGGDPIARMFHPNRLVLGYQLPLFQLLVAAAERLSDHPLAPRVLSALTGGLATTGFYVLAASLTNRRTARLTALLTLTNPLFVVYSLMPYQEPLMMALLAFGAAAYVAEKRVLASVLLGLACFTRYESWVVVAALAAVDAYRHRGKGLLETCALFGWAPAMWLVAYGGLAPPGTYVADSGWAWARLGRLSYLTGRVLVAAPYAILLAPWGFALAVRERGLQAFGAVVTAVIVATVVLGHDYPPGTSGVTERAAHVPLAAAVLFSGVALAASKMRVTVMAVVALSMTLAARQVRARSSEPVVRTSFEIASYLGRRLGPGDRALVVARPVDDRLINHYLGLIGERKPGELEAARRLVDELSVPEDYQRLVVSLRHGRQRLVEVGAWREEPVAVVVVFDDAQDRVPKTLELQFPAEMAFERGKKAAVFTIRHGGTSASSN